MYQRPARSTLGLGMATLFFGLLLALVVFVGVVNVVKWKHCSEDGGKYVKGWSLTGYVCVDKDPERAVVWP